MNKILDTISLSGYCGSGKNASKFVIDIDFWKASPYHFDVLLFQVI